MPESKKVSKLFLQISTGDASHGQPPNNYVVDILTTLMMDKFLFATF